MKDLFSVAIDGPAGAGKSTVARAVAENCGAIYLDTGAMYRAIGLWMRRHGIDPCDRETVTAHIDEVGIDVRYEGGAQRVFLDGEDVSSEIRENEISQAASAVSAHPAVRERMVSMQREIARGKNVVMDGRDIGTKVLPDATVKVFLTAAPEERARRRLLEMQYKGEECDYQDVLEAIRKRDSDDSSRDASPLCKAPDAVEIDSSRMDEEMVIGEILRLLSEARDK